MNLKDAKKGARVKTVGNTALGNTFEKLHSGMQGRVEMTGMGSVGVDLGAEFVGHSLDGSFPRPNGFWFDPKELKLVAKAKPAKKRARR